jgi:hypothetical protein
MAGDDYGGSKVVARLRDGSTLKGYLEELPELDFDALFVDAHAALPKDLRLRRADSGEQLKLPLNSLKALFFVRSFEGRKEYNEVKFFEKNPPIKGLWIRIRFYDGEYLEGVVGNSIDFVVEPGFYLKPPDSLCNNEILYVVKESLAEFRVLGVRMEL